jgi:hypothetical protein
MTKGGIMTVTDGIDKFAQGFSDDPRERMEWYMSLVVAEFIRNSKDSLPATETKTMAMRDILSDLLRMVDLQTFDICSFRTMLRTLLEGYMAS